MFTHGALPARMDIDRSPARVAFDAIDPELAAGSALGVSSSGRIETLGFEHARCGRRSEELDQRLGGLRLFGGRSDRGCKRGDELYFRRQWTNQFGGSIG